MQSAQTTNLVQAAFLDRDGVLNVDAGYTYRIQDWVWMPGAIDALHELKAAGYLVIIVTNQSGIARGYYSTEDMTRLHDHLRAEAGGLIDAIYFCPHGPDDGCDCRKPMPGMILRAAEDFHISLERSILVGDKTSDLDAASAAGVKGYLFQGGNLADFVTSILDH